MNTLSLKLTGEQNLNNLNLFIDNRPVSLNRDKFKNLFCNYETDKKKVRIEAYRYLDSGGIIWFIIQLFFFIISIFGLFDIHKRQNCLLIDFIMEVELSENTSLTLQKNSSKENEKVFEIKTDYKFIELSNKFVLDSKAKKTRKILFLSKIILAFFLIVLIISMLFSKIGV